MNKTIFLLTVFFFLLAGNAMPQSETWKLDVAHSNIEFITSYMSLTDVKGEFHDFKGTVMAGEEDFTDAKIEVYIQAQSIDTDNEKRDEHLRTDDFLHAKEYSRIIFTSNSLKKVDGKDYKLKGQLTIRDVTRTEEFDVRYTGMVEAMGKTRAGFKLTGSIDRFDYNVDWNKSIASGLIVSKEIRIDCDVTLVKEE
jgi:polyisoprenoid-binding protein YceI